MMGSIVSGGLAYKSNKDAQKQTARASRDLTRRMEQGAVDMTAYRPEAAEARMRALRARLKIAEPLNNLTGEITGRPTADLAPLGNSPLSMKPLPSQSSIYGADGKINEVGLRSHGIDPKDPNAQSLLEEKLRSYGYNAGTPSAPPPQPRGVRKVGL